MNPPSPRLSCFCYYTLPGWVKTWIPVLTTMVEADNLTQEQQNFGDGNLTAAVITWSNLTFNR